MQKSSAKYLDVAVPTPLRRSFQYLPIDGGDEVKIGCRVRIPFGRQRLVGVVIGLSAKPATDPSKLRPITEVLDQEPLLPHALFKLCIWAADYYHHPIGEVLATALPVLLRKGKVRSEPRYKLNATTLGNEIDPLELKRSKRQTALLMLLRADQSLEINDLRKQGFSSSIIKALIEKNLAQWQEIRQEKSASHPPERKNESLIANYQGIEPNPQQRAAISKISSQGTYLVHGITGSGKTEVYLRKIEQTLTRGKQVIVLVPEIGLTPQTLSRFTNRFNVTTELIHSGLTDLERLSSWRKAADGTAKIIIGTRSAIFTPLKDPGLLVVDEEHDASFKQQDGFRYSARDLAVMRSHLENIPIILGSATPSLESLRNCATGKYTLIKLTERTGGASIEEYQLIDLRNRKIEGPISEELIAAIASELRSGNQVLVFINRRGFSPVVYCQDCTWIAACNRCDARLTYHLAQGKLICHHCGYITQLVKACGECQSSRLIPLGMGTQRIEETLSASFPEFPVRRIDRDSTRRKGVLEKYLQELKSGQPMLLVGTQILAKGHHFPDVTLVAMLDIDAGFYSADYRSMEKTGQLILQVGGRSGREGKPGKVIIQTQFAQQPILKTLLNEGYDSFAQAILEERESNLLPPYSFHCLMRAESPQRNIAMDFLDAVAEKALSNTSVEMLGPVPASMEKRSGKYRAHLLFSSRSRARLHHAIAEKIKVAEALKQSKRVRWSVDVDPIELL
ncbi:MAG: primosomal protein N' [Pseudomonadales bacterium]